MFLSQPHLVSPYTSWIAHVSPVYFHFIGTSVTNYQGEKYDGHIK